MWESTALCELSDISVGYLFVVWLSESMYTNIRILRLILLPVVRHVRYYADPALDGLCQNPTHFIIQEALNVPF